MGYFVNVGRCARCDWPHHQRTHRKAVKARRWPFRRAAIPACVVDTCFNCGLSTVVSEKGDA